MITKVRIALVALLGITLFVVGLPISSAGPNHQGERRHNKKGAEVAKRVRQLQKYDKGVAHALAAFERNEGRNGHAPRIDDAESVTLDPEGGSAAQNMVRDTPFRKAGLTQSTDFSGYGVEMIFIPTYVTSNEWQGTVIFNKFDPSGGYIGQYVADVIVTASSSEADVNFEVSFEGDNAWLEYGDPGIYGNLGDPGAGGGFIQPAITSNSANSEGSVKFEKANYQLNPVTLGQRIGRNPRVRSAVKCTNMGGSAGSLACGAVALLDFGSTLTSCLLGVAVTSVSLCGMQAVFGS